jgi:predicted glutamine amidotransferase
MCIAIYKPENKILGIEVVENSFLWHPDGAGFMAHDSKTNTLIVKKGFFTVSDFMDAYLPYAHLRCVLHFRKATHGEKDADNCHPFLINENLAFVHNGVLRDAKMWDKKKSDTWHFGEAIFKPLINKGYGEIWKNKTFRYLIEQTIGTWNKFVMLDNEGNFQIFNEICGVWDAGCWFSNQTYLYSTKDFWDDTDADLLKAWANWKPQETEIGKSRTELLAKLTDEVFAIC